jgi:DNA-binding MarR family transcriptional regulator
MATDWAIDAEHGDEATAAEGDLPIYDLPGHLARRLNQIAVSIFLDGARQFGITPVQFSALTAVRHFSGIDQRRLSRAIAFDRSTIGDVVQRLQKKGLLRVEPGTPDRRTKHLYITPEGGAILDAMEGAVEQTNADLLKPLSDGEQAIFLFLLKKLVHLNNDMSRAPLLSPSEAPSRQKRRRVEGE